MSAAVCVCGGGRHVAARGHGLNDFAWVAIGGCCGRRAKWGRGAQTLRTAFHTMSRRLQNGFYESHSWRLVSLALTALNNLWVLPVYAFFDDEKSNDSDKKSVTKIR